MEAGNAEPRLVDIASRSNGPVRLASDPVQYRGRAGRREDEASRPALPRRDRNVRGLTVARVRDERANGTDAEIDRLTKVSVHDRPSDEKQKNTYKA